MTVVLHPYDVRKELEIQKPLDFKNRSQLKHVDQVDPRGVRRDLGQI